MRAAYADPPYIGCAHLYADHPDYGGEVDHLDLIARLEHEYDGWLLHCSVTSLFEILRHAEDLGCDYRVMAWVKPFAAFKANVPVAYAWEPVIVKPVRKPVVSDRLVLRDWIAEPITMQKGLVGAKPPAVIRWGFEVLGLTPDDELDDLFPGTGIVGETWRKWRGELVPGSDGQGVLPL